MEKIKKKLSVLLFFLLYDFCAVYSAVFSLALSEIKICNNYFACKYCTNLLLLIAHLILLLGRAASLKTLLALVMILLLPNCGVAEFSYLHKKMESMGTFWLWFHHKIGEKAQNFSIILAAIVCNVCQLLCFFSASSYLFRLLYIET